MFNYSRHTSSSTMLPYREDGVLPSAEQIDAQSRENDSSTSSLGDTKISAICSSSGNSDLDSDEDEVVFLPRGLRFKQQAAAMKQKQEQQKLQRQKHIPVQRASPVLKAVEVVEKSVVEVAAEGHVKKQESLVDELKEARNMQPTVEDEVTEPLPVPEQAEADKQELSTTNSEATANLESAAESKVKDVAQVPAKEQQLPTTIPTSPASRAMASKASSAKGGPRSPTRPRGPKSHSRSSNRRSSSPPAGPSMQPFVPGMQIDPNSFSRGPASGYVNITMQLGANRAQNQYQYQPFKHWHAGRGNGNAGNKRRGGGQKAKAGFAAAGVSKPEFSRNVRDAEKGGMMGSRARGGGKLWIP